jgi:23S rRNA pseudouridine2605 synthase
MPEERLQKILSQAGIASRRKAEELIQAGHVTVNGTVITELGSKADLERDHIKVNNKLLRAPKRHTYIALNKPKGCVTTMSDPEGRPTVMHLLRGVKERVFPVGRLDYNSEGLLLLTNDGEFAQRMAHPSYEVDKTYVAEVDGRVSKTTVEQLLAGVELDDGPVTVSTARVVGQGVQDRSIIELVIHEGRNRIVRRLLDHLGHPVRKLTRIAIGPVQLTGLKAGELRDLTNDELGALLDAAKL